MVWERRSGEKILEEDVLQISGRDVPVWQLRQRFDVEGRIPGGQVVRDT